MHYKNNREAHEGDPVVVQQYGRTIAGVLHSLSAAATCCNGVVSYPVVGGNAATSVTVGDCYHAEDAFLAVEAANSAAQLKSDSPATAA